MAKTIRGMNENKVEAEILNKKKKIYSFLTILFLGITIVYFMQMVFKISSGVNVPYDEFTRFGYTYIFLFGFPYVIFRYLAQKSNTKYQILASGLQGEDRLLNDLIRLNDKYLVMENIQMNVNGQRMEMDALVVSPYGLSLIECKNHLGDIQGNDQDIEWVQKKLGRGGTYYSKSFKNPFKQIGRTSWILKKVLRECNMNQIPMDTLVYFPACSSMNSDSDRVYTNARDLLNQISKKQKVVMSLDECQKLVKTILSHKVN